LKSLAIIGIILGFFWTMMSLVMISSEGVWMVFIGFAYFLAMSIVTLVHVIEEDKWEEVE
jgi:hypothetical protein